MNGDKEKNLQWVANHDHQAELCNMESVLYLETENNQINVE